MLFQAKLGQHFLNKGLPFISAFERISAILSEDFHGENRAPAPVFS
jgi:hypothetical protein